MSQLCKHEAELLDFHSGDIICTDCGRLSAGQLFYDPMTCLEMEDTEQRYQTPLLEEIKDILDRIHVPTSVGEKIAGYHRKIFSKKTLSNMIFSIYKMLNDCGYKVSIQELSAVTGVDKNKILQDQGYKNIDIDTTIMAEKYCVLLGLDYKVTEIIKRAIAEYEMSGHAPMTVIAGTIYKMCKKAKIKTSVKKISELTNVSSISIQRFNKQIN